MSKPDGANAEDGRKDDDDDQSRSAAVGVSPAVTPLAHPWLRAPLERLFRDRGIPRREIVHMYVGTLSNVDASLQPAGVAIRGALEAGSQFRVSTTARSRL